MSAVEVAVGVVFDEQGRILVAKRRSFQHLAHCWEFPGGKIEKGESQAAALKRELFEEVGITVIEHQPWLEITHNYIDKNVLLKVHRVTNFSGEARGIEGQKIQWVLPHQLKALTFPKANEKIIQQLIV